MTTFILINPEPNQKQNASLRFSFVDCFLCLLPLLLLLCLSACPTETLKQQEATSDHLIFCSPTSAFFCVYIFCLGCGQTGKNQKKRNIYWIIYRYMDTVHIISIVYYLNRLLLYNIVCSNDYDIQYCIMYVYTMFVHFN